MVFSYVFSERLPDEMVSSVVFSVSRYGESRLKISFPKQVTVFEAVKKVEAFLSQPLTKEYHAKYSNTEGIVYPFKEGECRGYILGSCIFLEGVNVRKGRAHLICGS